MTRKIHDDESMERAFFAQRTVGPRYFTYRNSVDDYVDVQALLDEVDR